MVVRVYHGTNSKILDYWRQKTGAVAPFCDPLIERVKGIAREVGSGFRAKMIKRELDVYISAKPTTAEGYSTTSPEVLYTSLNLIREASPDKAREVLQSLKGEGWLDVRPIVLGIRIENPGELGITGPADLTPELVQARAGLTDEICLAIPLPLDRIEESREIDQPHFIKTINDTLFKNRSDIKKERINALIESVNKLMGSLGKIGVEKSEAEMLHRFLGSLIPLLKIHLIFNEEKEKEEENRTQSPLLRSKAALNEMYNKHLRGFEEIFKEFLASTIRQKIKDLAEYQGMKAALLPILGDIARIYAHNWYLSSSSHYEGKRIYANMFCVVTAPGGHSIYNDAVFAADEPGFDAVIKEIIKHESVSENEAREIVEVGFRNLFRVVETPYFSRRA